MENTKKKNIGVIAIIAAVLVVAAAAFIIIYTQYAAKPTEGAKKITVDVVLADKSKTSFTINTDAQYLRQALEEKKLVVGDESDFGLYIKTVNGVTANEGKQEWWCLTKGGETVMTGVDTTPILDGDKFELTLTVGYDSFQ